MIRILIVLVSVEVLSVIIAKAPINSELLFPEVRKEIKPEILYNKFLMDMIEQKTDNFRESPNN